MKLWDGGRFCLYLQTGYDGKKSGALLMESTARFCAGAGLIPPEESALLRTASGMPYFGSTGAPHFSVSHSGQLWGAAFAKEQIGFDLECVKERAWESVARRFFHPEERAYALAHGGDAFFSVWTAKESYVKYLGVGIDVAFSEFSVVEKGAVSGAPLRVLFLRPPVPEGFSACVCMAEEEEG